MLLFSIFSPLIAAFIVSLSSRLIGGRGAIFLTVLGMGISVFILGSAVLFDIFRVHFNFGYWITFFGSGIIYWNFNFDFISLLMLFVVSTVSLCVHLFSASYLQDDPFKNRFFAYISIFTFFMNIFVLVQM